MLQLLGFPLVGPDSVPFVTHQEDGHQLHKRDKMGHLAKPIDYGEYDGVSTGAGQTGHKVHRDNSGFDVIPTVIVQGRPSKPLAK